VACTGRTATRWPSCARSSTTTGAPVSSACATSPRPPKTVSGRRPTRHRRDRRGQRKAAVMAEVVREIVIDATPDTIWPFLADPDRRVEWMGPEAELDPRRGGVYRVWVGGQNRAAGEFVEVVPTEKLVFTFGWESEEHHIPPASTTVEITLHREGSKTRVR